MASARSDCELRLWRMCRVERCSWQIGISETDPEGASGVPPKPPQIPPKFTLCASKSCVCKAATTRSAVNRSILDVPNPVPATRRS
jgi:hypothetical protein